MGRARGIQMAALTSSEVAKFQELAKSNSAEAKRLLGQIKLKLVDGSSDTPEGLALERTVFETAALLNIREKDIEQFQRHMSMLRPYYTDFGSILPPSEAQNTVLGLNLLRLLAQGSLDEFHTELETISAEQLNSTPIQFPVQLEQLSMEGSYHKVVHFRSQLPSPEYAVFMDTLEDTIRDEIASCLEKAYKSLSCTKAAQLLMLQPSALKPLAEERGWVIQADKVDFVSETVEKHEVPAMDLIEETLHYATELERIV